MSAIHTMPGHLIRRLQQISVSIFTEHMKTAGLDLTSPQFAALAVLRERPGIDQATLAGLIALDRQTIGGVVARLAAKGLVDRRASVTDGRAKSLSLTAQGEEVVRRMWPLVEATQEQILDGLSAAERAQFTTLAEKITRLHNHESRAPLVLAPQAPKQDEPG
jgi:DNA-binding MarR family transcriptional regulator